MRKFQTWLAWWILLSAFWLAVDDSLRADELAFGAVAAALAALLTAAALGGAGKRHWPRLAWLARMATLPGQVVRDTVLVFTALGRRLATGALPPGGYAEVPVRYGGDGARHAARRAMLTWARSLAPGTFVVDLDPDRDVMVVHHLAVSAPDVERVP